MGKAKTDYGKLLRYAEADLAHFATRLKNTSEALTAALDKVPGKQSIYKLIEAHGGNLVDHADAADRVRRYTATIERRAAETDGEAPSE